MVTHLAGENAPKLRAALNEPPEAVFANEVIMAQPNGDRLVRWIFLAEDGSVISVQQPAAATFDPRQRPWYSAALNADGVEHSNLYIFASSGEPGFTLSRRFGTPTRGVFGADLAARDITRFLRDQRVTPSSSAFIFTRNGEAVAVPDKTLMDAIVKSVKPDAMISLPKLNELGDPLLSSVFAQYEPSLTRTYDINGQSYIGRVIEIPPQYGKDQLLAVIVPLQEIERPIIEIRNETLFRSILILIFVLPLYATLVIVWIDRRLRAADHD